MPQSKVLFYDIETAGVNALKGDLGFVIVFGYKWAHEQKAHSIIIDQDSLKKFNDKKLLREVVKLLKGADIVVAHYGALFDKRFLQGRLMVNNLAGFPHPVMRDTCLTMRKVANFSSNRLKHLAKILDFRHQKLENDWPKAWFQVMRGNIKVLKALARYCKGDVLALEELYWRIAPYVKAWNK